MRKKSSTSSTGEPIEAGDPAEFNAVAGQVQGELAAEPAPEPESPEDELVDVAVEKLDELAKHPKEVERTLALLTEEELATVIELGFGLVADKRGSHWEISEKRSLRIAKWLKLSLEKHGQVVEWIASFLPEMVTALLLTYEIWSRVQEDRKLAKAKAEQPPAREPFPGTPAPAAT